MTSINNSESTGIPPKICRLVIQQCLNAELKFDTEDPLISIGNGMIVFTCFLQGATLDHLDNIVKAVVNAKLCEPGEPAEANSGGGRDSVLKCGQDILIIPQATLGGKLKGKSIQYHGLVSKSFGEELFYKFVEKVKNAIENQGEGKVRCGVYGARQILKMETNGPFTHAFEF